MAADSPSECYWVSACSRRCVPQLYQMSVPSFWKGWKPIPRERKSTAPFNLPVSVLGFFPSLVMKGQNIEELSSVQGYSGYPLAISVQHWIIYSSFSGRCVANFHTALMGIRLSASNPNSSSAPQQDCEALLSKGGVNSSTGTDRMVTAGRSMWVSLNKTW